MNATPMAPEKFEELFEAATSAPCPTPMDDQLKQGRKLLRRTRLTQSGGIVAAALLLAAGVNALAPAGGGQDDAGLFAAGITMTSELRTHDLLTACRTGNNASKATDVMFDGTPTIKAESRTTHQVRLALESADGRFWAECFVRLDAGEFAASLTAYATAGQSQRLQWSSGTGCGLIDGEVDPACTQWGFGMADRLPAVVDSVEFMARGGVAERVSTYDGYYAFEYLGELPNGTSWDSYQGITSMTYLNASGEPIAGQALDGSGSGADGEIIDDLPLLNTIPSLGADQAVE